MGTATLVADLSEAQQQVLDTMTRHARCVGARKTQPAFGWVHTNSAQSLVKLGLARHEVSATGAHVFVLSDDGRALLDQR